MVNEYFGVGVTSEAMDGEAPELNPGWVHRRTNTLPEVRHALILRYFNKAGLRRICTSRTSLMLLIPPQTAPLQVGRYAIHGYACRSTNEALINH